MMALVIRLLAARRAEALGYLYEARLRGLPDPESPPARALYCHPSASARRGVLPKVAESCAQIRNNQIWFLHCSEVPATFELDPAHDVVGGFSQSPDRERNITREHR
jgi:hypothetical protein